MKKRLANKIADHLEERLDDYAFAGAFLIAVALLAGFCLSWLADWMGG